MDPEQYLNALLSLPLLEESNMSPDGRWVAWTWYKAGPAADIYAAPTDGSAAPIRLTSTPHDTILVDWTPDSRSVLAAQDRDGNERAVLYRIDLNNPEVMLPLTDPDPDYYVHGGQMHPNGRWLFYGANYNFETGKEIEPTWLYRHDLETGQRTVIARPEKACYYNPKLNRQGTFLIYPRKDLDPSGEQLWLVDVEGKQDRQLLNAGDDKKIMAQWLPDGNRVLVLAETGTHQRVGVLDLIDGTVRWLLDDPARNIEEIEVPAIGNQVILIEYRKGCVYASLLDVDGGIETPILSGKRSLVPIGPSASGFWVGETYSSQQPNDLVLFDPAGAGELASLTRIWDRTTLTPEDLAPATDFRWQSVDGLEIQGWLYRPQQSAVGTIILAHGGPTWHIQDCINPETQYLVSQRMNVLDVNFRGSTGFGLAFREAIKVDGWGGREQQDILTGIQALIKAGIAQAGKVGISGTSFGGYSSWYAITHFPPELLAASVPICGMTDLVVDYETTRPDLRPYSAEMMGGTPDEVPGRYYERSPIHFVDRIRGKLLIVQGLQDPNVTPENVRAVEIELKKAGIPYELLTFDDEGHGIARPKNQKVLYHRMVEFFTAAFEG